MGCRGLIGAARSPLTRLESRGLPALMCLFFLMACLAAQESGGGVKLLIGTVWSLVPNQQTRLKSRLPLFELSSADSAETLPQGHVQRRTEPPRRRRRAMRCDEKVAGCGQRVILDPGISRHFCLAVSRLGRCAETAPACFPGFAIRPVTTCAVWSADFSYLRSPRVSPKLALTQEPPEAHCR